MTDPELPSAYDRRRSRRRLVFIGVLLVLATLAVVALLASRQHAANAARAAAACSDLDRASFEALRVNRPPATPLGQDDGACTLTTALPGDAATALVALDAAMTSDGWTVSGTGAGPRFYSRGPDLITGVPGASVGGTTGITLSIAPE